MIADLDKIREAAFALDEASQQQLADDIYEHLAGSRQKDEWMRVVRERQEAHRRGEGSTITLEELRVSVKKQIEDFKRDARISIIPTSH